MVQYTTAPKSSRGNRLGRGASSTSTMEQYGYSAPGANITVSPTFSNIGNPTVEGMRVGDISLNSGGKFGRGNITPNNQSATSPVTSPVTPPPTTDPSAFLAAYSPPSPEAPPEAFPQAPPEAPAQAAAAEPQRQIAPTVSPIKAWTSPAKPATGIGRMLQAYQASPAVQAATAAKKAVKQEAKSVKAEAKSKAQAVKTEQKTVKQEAKVEKKAVKQEAKAVAQAAKKKK